MRPLADRFARVMLALLVAIDQMAQVLLVAPFALAGLARPPAPDGTIGRHADAWWARLPAAIIDALFLVLTLGRERDHCARSAAREAARRCSVE